MGWFSKADDYTPEEDPPFPPRSASDEYLEGLKYAANVYDERAVMFWNEVRDHGQRIASVSRPSDNIASAITSIERSAARARDAERIAGEIRGWVGDFERGLRPPH